MRRVSTIALAALALTLGLAAADARPRGDGWAAFARGDYVRAVALLAPIMPATHLPSRMHHHKQHCFYVSVTCLSTA